MIEVSPNLFVGNEDDEARVRHEKGWFVISACKEPYHRQALGYTGRAAAKDHPEYLMARRPGRLILNLVDIDDVRYIADEIIDAALAAIDQQIAAAKVLVHCNQGLSRSPSIALLWLLRTGRIASQDQFRALYPLYAPAKGMADYVRINWDRFAQAGAAI